ncbi:MAG: murein biosynthesis integral membrane protein MurJ [Vicinamibacterales bacterium]
MEPSVTRVPTTKPDAAGGGTGRAAAFVATGILVSRLVGLVRQRVISHYFGLSTDAADAWAAGFRIPNLLQNLFGEGALSASFVPVYAGLRSQQRSRDADAVAAVVGWWLVLLVSASVAIGVWLTPWAIGLIAPGFSGEKRALTIAVVRVLFPGAGLLVMSAWCLGILNSHRRFFLSYASPVAWSVVMIAAMLWYGPSTELPRLVVILAWASVAGTLLQLMVQLPLVFRLAPGVRARRPVSVEAKQVMRNFLPTLLSRGVVQFSAYIDTVIASWLPLGAVAALTNAQTLYTLPVSLFGISIAAVELPAMSAQISDDNAAFDGLRLRLNASLRRIAFFVVPSAVAFVALGDVIAAALLQTGRFGPSDAVWVWKILAGSSIGLLASTLGRLYASTFFALRDTRSPLRFAVVRVVLTSLCGYLCAIPLPRALGLDPAWGTAGLTASAGLAGWVELLLLRRALNARIGPTGVSVGYVSRLWVAAAVGAATGRAVTLVLPAVPPVVLAVAVLGPYGVVFLGLAVAFGVTESVPRQLHFWR